MSVRRVRAVGVGARRASILLLLGFSVGALVGPLVARVALAARHAHVTVYGGASDPVVLRLIPELTALGCIVRADASPAPEPAALTEGDAALRVTETTVTFWLLDPRTGRAHEAGAVAIPDRGAEGTKTTSVRVSEILRAELLDVEPGTGSPGPASDVALPVADAGIPEAPRDAAPDASSPATSAAALARPSENAAVSPPAPVARSVEAQPSPDRAASPAASPVAPAPPAHLSAGLGPLLLLAPGGTKPAVGLALSPEWSLSRSLQLRMLLAAPVTSPSVVATGGQAAISTRLAGLAADWRVSSSDDGWRGTLGGGAAVVVSHAQGTASAGYAASGANAVAALPFAAIGGSRALGTPRVRLGASGMLGVALPPLVVQFAARNVATWGPVVGALSMALDVDIW